MLQEILEILATWILQHFRKHQNPCNIDIATFSKFSKSLQHGHCNNYYCCKKNLVLSVAAVCVGEGYENNVWGEGGIVFGLVS